ncbi:hypothetical protein SLE2022_055590 [Rubroshorea leprosula]
MSTSIFLIKYQKPHPGLSNNNHKLELKSCSFLVKCLPKKELQVFAETIDACLISILEFSMYISRRCSQTCARLLHAQHCGEEVLLCCIDFFTLRVQLKFSSLIHVCQVASLSVTFLRL